MEQIDNTFDNWNIFKKQLNKQKKKFHIRQGEIWFISVGQNIGYEIYGKGEEFLRPVLVFRKINQNSFLGIPLTSKEKDDRFHMEISFKNKKSNAILTQIKTFDSRRLKYKTGSINREVFGKLERKVIEFYDLTPNKRGGYTYLESKQRVNAKIIAQSNNLVNSMDGIVLTQLKQIHNPKGDIYHAMKKSDNGFDGFGEAYFSTIHQGDIKGWKKHIEMTLNLVVVHGEIEFVVYNETTKEFFSTILSRKNYHRLTVKNGLWVAFRGVGKENMLLNLASIEHNPKEAMNINLWEISYQW